MPDSPEPEPLTIYIDGASRGNPGPASYAVIVKSADGKHLASLAKPLGNTTNNFAEYQALLAALDYAIRRRSSKVSIISDSELLVRQIQGRYRVRSEDLKPLHARATSLIQSIEAFSIKHVLRSNNREADRLANQVLDGKLPSDATGSSAPRVETAGGEPALHDR